MTRNWIENYSSETIKITDGLKGRGKNWKWTAEMNNLSIKLKEIFS